MQRYPSTDHSRQQTYSIASLQERFEVIKEIGGGAFGSVALAKVRANGVMVAHMPDYVAIKTTKRTFDSPQACSGLREVLFFRKVPRHEHLIWAFDIFLDPLSKKLHICVEYMHGNLVQLISSQGNDYLDMKHTKSILLQLFAGLDHIHAYNFFHRDMKPEKILVSMSTWDSPTYAVKIADFGSARQIQSILPYSSYVTTRWYRAPEILLRAIFPPRRYMGHGSYGGGSGHTQASISGRQRNRPIMANLRHYRKSQGQG
ncbi:Serine/threonine protein kinase, partial [Exophiala xenobiotica]